MGKADATTEWGKSLFYLSYTLILVRALLYASTFMVYLSWFPRIVDYIWRIVTWLPIFVKFFTQDTFTLRTLERYAVFACIVLICTAFGFSTQLIEPLIVIVGVHGVGMKEAVRVFFYVASFLTAVLFVLSLFGAVENYLTWRGDTPRYAFGAVYATDFAARLFYLELAHAFVKRKKYHIADFIVWACVALFVLLFCDARLDFILILAFACVMLLLRYVPKIFSHPATGTVMQVAVPILCLLAISLHFFYTSSDALFLKLNELLSGRLYYGRYGIDQYGFSLFGQPVQMQGWGFSLTDWDETRGYFFIDCGWLSMTLTFGVFAPVFFSAFLGEVSGRYFAKGTAIIPVICLFLALTSMVDHHLPEIANDPFLLLASLILCSPVKGRGHAVRTLER